MISCLDLYKPLSSLAHLTTHPRAQAEARLLSIYPCPVPHAHGCTPMQATGPSAPVLEQAESRFHSASSLMLTTACTHAPRRPASCSSRRPPVRPAGEEAAPLPPLAWLRF